MLLCVDIGNTNIVLGCYDKDHWRFLSRISTDRTRMGDQYAVELKDILALYDTDPADFAGAVLSSVVPQLTNSIAGAIETILHTEPQIITARNTAALGVAVDDPSELGSDFVAAAVAAKEKYPLPLVVIDMGTATTLSAISPGGEFLGVSILPGLRVSTDALVQNTSLLRGISLEAPARAIGTNTPDAMKSGIIFGAAGMIDALIDRFWNEMGARGTVVATGGLAEVVIPHCKNKIIHDDMLLMDGLRIIYEKQNQ